MAEGKLLIIHQGAIGDLILSLPAINALRKHFSHLTFYFMGYPEYLEILPVERDRVISIHMSGFSSLYTREPNPPPWLKQYLGQYEKVIIFGKKGDETLINGMKMVGVKGVFRIDTSPDQGIHAIDHQVSILSSMGIEVKDRIPHVSINDEERRFAQLFFMNHHLKENDHVIFIHPGSGSLKKAWPPTYFSQLAKYLSDRLPVKIAVIQGPADGTQTEAFYTHFESVSTVKVESPPLRMLAALMEFGNCFLGNDSGISHLSSAVGIPTIALFGPTDPAVWGPRGEHVHILTERTDCSPCDAERLRRCIRQECLEGIKVETVCRVIESIVS